MGVPLGFPAPPCGCLGLGLAVCWPPVPGGLGRCCWASMLVRLSDVAAPERCRVCWVWCLAGWGAVVLRRCPRGSMRVGMSEVAVSECRPVCWRVCGGLGCGRLEAVPAGLDAGVLQRYGRAGAVPGVLAGAWRVGVAGVAALRCSWALMRVGSIGAAVSERCLVCWVRCWAGWGGVAGPRCGCASAMRPCRSDAWCPGCGVGRVGAVVMGLDAGALKRRGHAGAMPGTLR